MNMNTNNKKNTTQTLVKVVSKRNRDPLTFETTPAPQKSVSFKTTSPSSAVPSVASSAIEVLDLSLFKEAGKSSYRAERKKNLEKTKLCKTIYTTRRCRENCTFAHSLKELVRQKCRYGSRCYGKDSFCKHWHELCDDFNSWCARNGFAELKEVSCVLAPKRVVIQKPASKVNTKLCNTVKNGKTSCAVGCLYAHSLEDLVLLKCGFDADCNKKETCLFKHSSETRNECLSRLGLDKYKGVVVEKSKKSKIKPLIVVKTSKPDADKRVLPKTSGITWKPLTKQQPVSIRKAMEEEEVANALLSLK